MSEESAQKILSRPRWLIIAGWVLGIIVLFNVIIGIYWSRQPDVFWVNRSVDEERIVVGYATTDTLIRVAETMLDKPGGFLSNDVMPPSVFWPRPKVESAIVITHKATGICGQASERRSQHENRDVAIERLRLNLAVGYRRPRSLDQKPSQLWKSRTRGGRVRIAIDAPEGVTIHRDEVFERIAQQNRDAALDTLDSHQLEERLPWRK